GREADASSADWAVEGNAGNSESGGGADHGRDIRIIRLAGGHDRTDNLNFVHETIGEERANGTVDQTRSQRFFLTGTTFTLEETAGDFTCCVGAFLIMH